MVMMMYFCLGWHARHLFGFLSTMMFENYESFKDDDDDGLVLPGKFYTTTVVVLFYVDFLC